MVTSETLTKMTIQLNRWENGVFKVSIILIPDVNILV